MNLEGMKAERSRLRNEMVWYDGRILELKGHSQDSGLRLALKIERGNMASHRLKLHQKITFEETQRRIAEMKRVITPEEGMKIASIRRRLA